jgi:hypothetical protein
MELFSALLAGFFSWLLVFHWYRRTSARRRERAGALLFRADNAIPPLKRHRSSLIACAYMLLCLLGTVSNVLISRQATRSDLPFQIAAQFTVALLFAVPLGRTDIALEVREQGVLHSMSGKSRWLGRLNFTAWGEIRDCKWTPTVTAFQARPFLGILRLAEDVIGPQQRAAATAALGRFVPVYDRHGVLLAKPDERTETELPLWRKQTYDPAPFQFDLQSLLILTVAVACAASCCGIHYRRFKPQWDAIARLESLGARIRYFDGRVWEVDLSTCTKKPTDDDLALLEPLAELEDIDLSDAPVTDAGLRHLRGLKKLRSVVVTNTRITSQGIKELNLALPDVAVTVRPPNVVPSAPLPKATGKK